MKIDLNKVEAQINNITRDMKAVVNPNPPVKVNFDRNISKGAPSKVEGILREITANKK